MDTDGGSAVAAAAGEGAVDGSGIRRLLLKDLNGNPVRLAAQFKLDTTKVPLPWLPALGLARTGSSFRWLGAGLANFASVE